MFVTMSKDLPLKASRATDIRSLQTLMVAHPPISLDSDITSSAKQIHMLETKLKFSEKILLIPANFHSKAYLNPTS